MVACSIDENCAAKLLHADMQCVIYLKTLVPKAFFHVHCFKKLKRGLQEDKSLCFLVDMNLSASGQQRIELGSLFCVASAGRSDFTLF